MCELLLSLGADPNAATRSGGATALQRAAYTGHVAVVRLLLAAGAAPAQQDGDGQTALHKAVQQVRGWVGGWPRGWLAGWVGGWGARAHGSCICEQRSVLLAASRPWAGRVVRGECTLVISLGCAPRAQVSAGVRTWWTASWQLADHHTPCPAAAQGHTQVAEELLAACPGLADVQDRRGRRAADLAPS